MGKLSLLLSLIVLFLFTSCEAFFTNSWFQGAADYSNISVAEALSSGDTSVMRELYDDILVEASAATGEEAAGLYLQAADLALGISGMSDPSVLLNATTSLDGGGTDSLFSILTDSDVDLAALANVDDILEAAKASDPASVPADIWLFAAAGSSADIVNASGGGDISTYLSFNPGPDPLDNPDVVQSLQYMVYAMSAYPDIESQLTDPATKADLITYGVIFP